MATIPSWALRALLASLFVIWLDLGRPELLIVGNITDDVIDGSNFLGGAVTYAAVVASAFGAKACIVSTTTSKAGSRGFQVLEGHDVHLIPSNSTLTFEHTYTFWGNQRKLRVADHPDVALTLRHVPPRCRRAKSVLICPLTPTDVDVASFVNRPASILDRLLGTPLPNVGLLAQGLQRELDPVGRVLAMERPSEMLKRALGPNVFVFLSDVETDVWDKDALGNVAKHCNRVLVTRGRAGADELVVENGELQIVHYPAYQVPKVEDTNGAGDSFAVGYMLAISRIKNSSPGAVANWAGSQAVSLPQTAKPQSLVKAIRDNKAQFLHETSS